MIRAVLDPGVLIAGLISPAGAPAGLLLAWHAGKFDLVVSPAVLEELERVLIRPKFRRYVTSDDIQDFIAFLDRHALHVEDPPPLPGATPDPGDDYLVALARAAGAHALVSGDAHLTQIPRADPPVLTPRQFLDRLG